VPKNYRCIGGLEVKFYAFVTWTLNRDELSASPSGRFIYKEKTFGSWLSGPRGGLDLVKLKKS